MNFPMTIDHHLSKYIGTAYCKLCDKSYPIDMEASAKYLKSQFPEYTMGVVYVCDKCMTEIEGYII